ncbi:aldo/keto reductase [Halovivax cerinus]|uniref:Aldo/keto reductase n=1 Tax=Halovivax cerinus TaxID=1487865 RepID=A0ABD5NS55_9EURY|nr:aldo/keto reductase [Halovivax cerinus]
MRRELTDGYEVSPILKGGWQLSESHSDDKSATPIDDMFAFVDAGITTFDCADIYTGVEELIGEFRAEYRRQRGEDAPVQVHTKFVPDRGRLETVDRSYVEQIIDRSRERLGVEALDLVQFHWWDFSVDNYVETAEILADLHDEGKIRHVGVTNFDVSHLRELLDAGVPVVSNQVQYSLLDDRPERDLVECCREEGVQMLCFGTLAGGFLTGQYHGEPDPGAAETLENRSLTKYKLVIEDAGGWGPYQDLLDTVESIADKHDVSIANVATRYILERPQVCAAIVGARDTSHLDDNLRTLEFSLDEADHRRIEDARSNLDELPGGVYDLERGTGKHARIMKYNLNEE